MRKTPKREGGGGGELGFSKTFSTQQIQAQYNKK